MRSFPRQECTCTLVDNKNASATSRIISDYGCGQFLMSYLRRGLNLAGSFKWWLSSHCNFIVINMDRSYDSELRRTSAHNHPWSVRFVRSTNTRILFFERDYDQQLITKSPASYLLVPDQLNHNQSLSLIGSPHSPFFSVALLRTPVSWSLPFFSSGMIPPKCPWLRRR